MKNKNKIAALATLAMVIVLPSCTTVVKQDPAPVTTTQATTTTTATDPITGTSTYKKTTTTAY